MCSLAEAILNSFLASSLVSMSWGTWGIGRPSRGGSPPISLPLSHRLFMTVRTPLLICQGVRCRALTAS